MTIPVFRFAPSPNGYLHLGHARSALINDAMAREAGGRFLLRIEDIDLTRCRPEYEAAIHDDLAWLGLEWERPVRRQSEHMDVYADALERLTALGLIYESFESRGEIRREVEARETTDLRDWPRDPDGAPLFPFPRRAMSDTERARRRESGEPFALRLDMAAAMAEIGRALAWNERGTMVPAHPELWGDVILARKDTPTSYHLSVVVDDALQGISHVVRGLDLYEATAIHRLLQELLGLPAPLYHHHTLLLDADGRKLAKSIGSESLRALRENGAAPEDVSRLALDPA